MALSDWPPAWQAIWLLAVDPIGLGGLCLRGAAGPTRDAWLADCRRAWPAHTPWRRVPLQVDDERLLGGLDLGLSLAAGRPVHQAGLLAEAAGGVVILPMAERADAALAGRLVARFDAGPGFCLLALDEGLSEEERPPAALTERLGLLVTLTGDDAGPATTAFASRAAQDHKTLPAPIHRTDGTDGSDRTDRTAAIARWAESSRPLPDLDAARARWRDVPYDAATVQALCATAVALGIGSMRTVWHAWCAARAAAALEGRTQVVQADAEWAARYVLAPRARSLPQREASADQTEADAGDDADTTQSPDDGSAEAREPPPMPTADPSPPDQDAQARTEPPHPAPDRSADAPHPAHPPDSPMGTLEDQTLAAARAAIPAGLLDSLTGGLPRAGGGGGRKGAAARPAQSGRPLASRRGAWRRGSRIDLLATLRAAIPFQRLREQERTQRGLGPAPTAWLLRREDLHLRRFRRPQETTTVFVVDASGSQAMSRLAEAKGAVELLLADCYVRRDRVALLAFRGSGAELLLPPTRSLARARRALSSLPGGGGTPLAAGIEAAWLLAHRAQAQAGARVVLVFLTDARANIARDGRGGRAQAAQDALSAAQRVRAEGLQSLLIDTSSRPEPAAMQLAQTLGARYVALPHGQAAQVYAAVSAAVASPGASPGPSVAT